MTELREPAHLWIPEYPETFGPEVGELCTAIGFAPDPEQQLALNAIFAVNDEGASAVFDTTVIGPRQNIKTGLLKQVAIGWLFVRKVRFVIWSAHELATAQEAERDLVELIEGSDMLRKRVRSVNWASGKESIQLVKGQRIRFKTRTKTGGRGLSAPKVIFDEAFALDAAQLGSLMPLLSVQPDPQLVYGSSAGLASSAPLRDLRDAGRAGKQPRSAYIEFCDDLPGDCQLPKCDHNPRTAVGCKMDDERRWYRANPQLQRFPGEPGRRMTIQYLRDERQKMPADEFGRERLGYWDADPSGGGPFPPGTWNACRETEVAAEDSAGGRLLEGTPMYGIAVTVDRLAGSIGAAGDREDGLPQLEVVQNGAGTDWIIPRLVEITAENGGAVVIDPQSPAGSLLKEAKDAGLRVYEIKAQQYAQECGYVYDAVENGKLRHLDQRELNDAVRDTRLRDLAGGFAWDLRQPLGDITPLVATTVALWGFRTYGGDVTESVW